MAPITDQVEANEAFLEGQADAARVEVRRDSALWSLLPVLVAHAAEQGVAREALERGTRLRHEEAVSGIEGDRRTLWVLDWQVSPEYEIAVDCRSGELVSHDGAAASATVVEVASSRRAWLDPQLAIEQLLERVCGELQRGGSGSDQA